MKTNSPYVLKTRTCMHFCNFKNSQLVHWGLSRWHFIFAGLVTFCSICPACLSVLLRTLFSLLIPHACLILYWWKTNELRNGANVIQCCGKTGACTMSKMKQCSELHRNHRTKTSTGETCQSCGFEWRIIIVRHSSLKVSLKTFAILNVKCKEEDACSIIFGTKHNGFARQTCSYCCKSAKFHFCIRIQGRPQHTCIWYKYNNRRVCNVTATLPSVSFLPLYHLSRSFPIQPPKKESRELTPGPVWCNIQWKSTRESCICDVLTTLQHYNTKNETT